MGVIKTSKLTKTFGKLTAISDVDLDIKKGSITGFLGPNGAGKSTTMNILMSFIAASSGEAFIFDERVSVTNLKTRASLGFLSSKIALDKSLTAGQEIEYFGHLAGEYNNSQVEDLAKKLNLDLKQKIRNLSTGNYQKVALIIALMNDPKLLILDEPTNGLDPLVKEEFNRIIVDLKKRGSTIFISSHILSEVDELCDNFVFIKNGKIVGTKTRGELGQDAPKIIRIDTSEQDMRVILKLLKKNKIKYVSVDNENLETAFMSYYEDNHV
jgi:ABC-2 type transport system ATP-binding protein